MLTPGRALRVARRPVHRLRAPPRAAAGDGLRSGSSASTRSSCARRSSRRSARTTSRRPGPRASDERGSSAPTPFPTPCCRRSRSSRINLGYVVAGAITVEVVFNWPGLGTLTVDALDARDYPVLQGVFLLLSVASSSPTWWPTSSTASSTRGSGHDAPATATGRAAPAERWALRDRAAARLRRAGSSRRRRRRRAGHPGLLHGPGDRPGALRRAAPDGHRRRRGTRLEPPSRGPHPRDRRARPRHAQPDRPRRAHLDGHRPAGDDHHGRRRGAHRIVSGLRRRADRHASSCASRTSSWSCRRSSWRSILAPIILDIFGATPRSLGIRATLARHRHRHRHHELGVDRPDHPVADAVAEGADVRRPGPGHRRGSVATSCAATSCRTSSTSSSPTPSSSSPAPSSPRRPSSFIGLGDPFQPSWGQILNVGRRRRRAGPRGVVVHRAAGDVRRPRHPRVHPGRQRPRRHPQPEVRVADERPSDVDGARTLDRRGDDPRGAARGDRREPRSRRSPESRRTRRPLPKQADPDAPLLVVENLRTHFTLESGTVKAVDGVSASRSTTARRSGSPASRAAARRRPRCRWSASCRRTRRSSRAASS